MKYTDNCSFVAIVLIPTLITAAIRTIAHSEERQMVGITFFKEKIK